MNVVRNQRVRLISNVEGVIWGHIKSKYPADFFAFQVALDKFSESPDALDAVSQFIITPVIENLRKGFQLPGVI